MYFFIFQFLSGPLYFLRYGFQNFLFMLVLCLYLNEKYEVCLYINSLKEYQQDTIYGGY